MLTKRKKQLLDFTKKYTAKHGFSPTLAEMKKQLKVRSLSTIHQHLKELEREGYINQQKRRARSVVASLSEKMIQVPIFGRIAAGAPIEAIKDKETIAVPQSRLPFPTGNYYALRVAGDSMKDENINDKDIVLVQKQSTAENGQKVVALVNGNETTLKTFYKEKNHIRLQPANKNYEPIIVPRNTPLEVQGVVVEVIRDIDASFPYFSTPNISIYKDDILKITSIPNNSVDLIVTSPPYNVDIHYNSHKDDLSYEEYLEFTKRWIQKCFELTKIEGRFLLNIPLDKNKGGQKSVGADITNIAKEIGWKYHSTIIWNEGNISRRTAWGSFMSASAPYVIAPVELILVLYKDSWKKTGGSRRNDITKQEFMNWTNGVWTFNGQSKKGAGGHPAPFPIELPRRCIKLFSFVDDTVLDPFLGSGSTLIAASLHNRKGIGVDIDEKYCNIAIDRLRREERIIPSPAGFVSPTHSHLQQVV
jgi:site-specific DNA-methyltransferase (adenine-specific)